MHFLRSQRVGSTASPYLPRLLLLGAACCGLLAVSECPASAAFVGYGPLGDISYMGEPHERNWLYVTDFAVRRERWVQIFERSRRNRLQLRRGCQVRRPAGAPEMSTPTTGDPLVDQLLQPERLAVGRFTYCRFPAQRSRNSERQRSLDAVIPRVLELRLGDLNDTAVLDLERRTAAVVTGGAGIDVISGGDEIDQICSGVGLERGGQLCQSAPGEALLDRHDEPLPYESLSGGGGNDQLFGTADAELLTGDAGNDTLLAGAGDDVLNGGEGRDIVDGQDGNDYLETSAIPPRNGVQSDDWAAGSDTVIGGEGFDTYGFAFTEQSVTATGNSTTRSGSDGSETDTYSGIEVLQLSRGNDTFSHPIAGQHFRVFAYGGDDQINLSGDPNRTNFEEVSCGDGDDSASVDANDQSRAPSPSPIRPDGADSDCERINYVYP